MLKRGTFTAEERETLLQQIHLTTKIQDGQDADLVIEAIPERLDLKQDLFRQLDEIVQPNAILASKSLM